MKQFWFNWLLSLPFGFQGGEEVTENHSGDDDAAADESPFARSFFENQKDPDGIEDGFDDGDEAAFQGGYLLNSNGIEDIGKADLEGPKEDEAEPAPSAWSGREHERDGDKSGEKITHQD